MSQRWNKLSFKLPFILLAVSLVPLLILGLLAISFSTKALNETQFLASHRTAVQAAKLIDHQFENNLFALINIAENLNFVELDPFDLEWGLLTLLKQHPEIAQASFLNPQGHEIVKVAVDQTFTQKDLQDRSSEALFVQALAGSSSISTGVSRAESYWVDLSIPLTNAATGSFSGVLIAMISSIQMLDNITQMKIGDAGQVYIVDQQGRVIAHPDNSKVLANKKIPYDFQRGTGPESGQTQNVGTYFSLDGLEVLGVFSEVSSTKWQVVVERPLAEINAASFQIRQILLSLFAAVLFLVVVIATYFIRRITRPIKKLELGAIAIGNGEFAEEIDVFSRDEIGRLASAFNLMRKNLIEFAAQDAHQNWLNNGLSELENQIRGENDLAEISRKAITCLAKLLEVPVAALYVKDQNSDHFHFSAGFACSPERQNLAVVPGQGVLGQCLLERKIVEINDLPANYLHVSSGLGASSPTAVLVAPLIYNRQLVGLLEFGSFGQFEARHKELLKLVSMPLAVDIETVRSSQLLAAALEESQRAHEELQTQQEELRVANEELEDQAQQLKSSEEQLRVQQEELQVTNEELEEKTLSLDEQKKDLLNRNLELQNTKIHLEQKSVEVERGSRYKSEFLANMSHELRTPLNSLLILSQDLANNGKGNLLPEQVEAARIVYNSGNDLLKLINEILDLAKIESGKLSLAVSDVPISEIIGRLESGFRHIANEHQLGFEISSAATVPETIRTDPARLDQILKNLVSNALKFTEEGQVTITVNPVENRDGAISIAVTDTGIGIAPENLDAIFNAFQQIDGSISRKFSGTGLGLSISRELTKLLGGELLATSQPEVGSTFTLILAPYQETTETDPALAPKATRQRPQEQVQAPPIQTPTKKAIRAPSIADERDLLQPEDKSILIIEDDLTFAKVLAERCQQRGFKFLHAGDGETGLELVNKYAPDAIILDMRLPGIQGLEVLDAIKGNPKIRHIPVHIMSATENTGEAFAHGAIGFLQKPIKPEQLGRAFGKLEEMISGKIRNLLIIEDDLDQQKSIQTLIGNGDVRTLLAGTGAQALKIFAEEQIDCMILDLNLPKMTGLEFLKRLSAQTQRSLPPVIIYSAQELSHEEVEELNEYTQSIIIKGAESPARLLDEASLFLHRVVGNLPLQKQQMINELYDQDNLFRGQKILLVDDDMRNVFAIAKILEDKGARVIKAANGQKALDALAVDDQVSLVLMDIMMPVMDGLQAIKLIRAQKQFARLPIIALTAKAMEEDRKRCIEAGANDYLSKPVEINRLLSLLRVWMTRK